jgi:hypothetical protein
VGVGIAAHVLFEQPGREFVAQEHGAGLPLGEGDEVVLLGGGEHALEGIVGRGEPLLPQLFSVIGRGRRGSHGRSTQGENGQGELPIPSSYHPGQRAAAELHPANSLPGGGNQCRDKGPAA